MSHHKINFRFGQGFLEKNTNTHYNENMTKRELLKILSQEGWQYLREGRHEIWGKNGKTIPIPRHAGDIPKGTVNNILKRAGVKK